MADPPHTPALREEVREEIRSYVCLTLFKVAEPGISHLDLVLPALTPPPTEDDIYGLQRRGDTTRRALGHIGDPTASTALTVEQRKRAAPPRIRFTHAEVMTTFDGLKHRKKEVLQTFGEQKSVRAAAHIHHISSQVFYDRLRDALDDLAGRLYQHDQQRGSKHKIIQNHTKATSGNLSMP